MRSPGQLPYCDIHVADGGLRGAEGGLAKTLTAADIIAYGIGSTVGAGLFVVTGESFFFYIYKLNAT